jgi:hypothetical protein
MKMNYCKDCIHHQVKEKHPRLGQCTRRIRYHPVDGSMYFYDAWDERMALGTCGPDGIHFVPIPHVSHSDIAAEQMQAKQAEA